MSPASPRLPLPCPGKGFGKRRTWRSCARGRRPSSGRRTFPRRRCPSWAVFRESARCPASTAWPWRERLVLSRRRGSVHPGRERRGSSNCCALAPPPAPAGPPQGGARSRGPAPAAVCWGWRSRPLESRAWDRGRECATPDAGSGLWTQTNSDCSLLGFALHFDCLLYY